MRITCWTHLISLACISLPVNAYQCIHSCFAARCLVFVLSVLALTQRGKKYLHGSGGAFDPTWEEALASLGFTRLHLCPPCFGLAHIISVPFHVLLRAPVPSSGTYCHCRLSPRWPVVRDDADLCAWGRRLVHNRVWQQGDGLMRLAGHTWRHWPVSSRPCDCRMSRPALNRVAWEADFDPMWEEARRLSHRQLFQKQLFHLQLCHTHTPLSHSYATLSHTTFLKLSILHHFLRLSSLVRTAWNRFWLLEWVVLWSFPVVDFLLLASRPSPTGSRAPNDASDCWSYTGWTQVKRVWRSCEKSPFQRVSESTKPTGPFRDGLTRFKEF